MLRSVTRRYRDPLDEIWMGLAARLGFKVARAANTYASSDGARTITIGTPETMDADDSLAQMLLHEICHFLVEGEGSVRKRDWGLDNETDRDADRERACLRLQAVLCDAHGLRRVLAPTTDYRSFYDTLAPDPLTPVEDPTVIAARAGAARADLEPFSPHLHEALAATATILRSAASFVPAGELALALEIEPPRGRNRRGFVLPHPDAQTAGETCGACAWCYLNAGRTAVSRCRQSGGRRVDRSWPACDRFEPVSNVDCQVCGACCRAAYDSVVVPRRDPVLRAHPELIVQRETYAEIRRQGDRCAALEGGGLPGERYACRIYQDRPQPCRDFVRGGAHCLTARRRVGLSR